MNGGKYMSLNKIQKQMLDTSVQIELNKIPEINSQLLDTVKVINVESHGAVPNGTNDDSLSINSAIDFAESVGRKTVYVPDGTYNIHSTIVVKNGIHLQLSPKAVLKAKQNVNVVQLKPDSKITSGVIDTSEVALFTKACIYLNGNDIFKLLNDHSYGNGTILKGKDHEYTDQNWTGIGVHLYSGKGSDNNPSYVSFVRFMQMGIFNFEYGILLETDTTIVSDSEMSWVNGNTFDQINMMNCLKNITLIGDSNIPRDVSGNNFSNIQMQLNSYSEWAINVEGGWNNFNGTWWDLHIMDSDQPAFRFGQKSRFNKIETMHGYETPRHYQDNGYMNTIDSLTNHVPEKRNLFHPFARPYQPNSLGNQDDYLVGGHLRGYTVTQKQTTDPSRNPTITHPLGMDEVTYVTGNFNTLFNTNTELGVTWDGIQTNYDNPIVLEIDLTSDPVPFVGHIGIISAYDAFPKNLVVEVYDTSWIEYGDWYVDNTQNAVMVTAPWANGDRAAKIRLTFWGSNKSDGLIQISRVFAMSCTRSGNAYIPKDGGIVDGKLNLKGGLVIETRTSDPLTPEVGRMWLRSDL
jgi:hypothetical protein